MFTRKRLMDVLLAGIICGLSTPVMAAPEPAPPEASQLQPVAVSGTSGPPITRAIVRNPSRPTVALSLGGGGVRGAAHIGVLRVLAREHIPVDYIAGSSMGAVIGGMYAAGVSLDSLEQMFRDRSVFKAFTPVPVTWKLMTVPPRMLLRSTKRAIGMKPGPIGLYSTNNVAEFVNSSLRPDRRNIEQTLIPFVAVATDLLDGKAHSLQWGNLGKAVQASSAIPFYVRPIPLNGRLLVDGGLRANLPSCQARQSGADIVIAVNVDDSLLTIDRKSLSSARRFGDRLVSIILAEMDQHQSGIVDLEIRPSLVGIPLYSRSAGDASRAMRAGEEAAIRAVPRLRALMSSKLALSP